MTRSRLRPGMLLLAVVAGHILVISFQVNTESGMHPFERGTQRVFSELQRRITGTVGGVAGWWDGYVALQSVEVENDVLRQELADVRFLLQQERVAARRVPRLEQLLGLRRDIGHSTVAARVIAGDSTPYFRTVTIDRGTDDNVRPDSAVVSPDGVVGRVVGDPGPRAARVQLLVDRSAAAGALVERTELVGVVMGDADEGLLRMDFVPYLEDVVTGDVVVTSGTDGIYPKGFVIGDVETAERGAGLYKIIQVRPRVNFNVLDDLLVIVDESDDALLAAGGQ